MIVQHRNFGAHSIIKCGLHENHNYGLHIHQSTEIVYVLKGEILSTINGKNYTFSEGEFTILTPLTIHNTATPIYSEIFICVLSNDFFSDIISEKELYDGYSDPRFVPSPELVPYLKENFIKTAVSYALNRDTQSYRTVKACLHAIFAEYTQKVSRAETHVQQNVLSKLVLYLSEHFKEELSINTVGKAIGYTSGHISHCLTPMKGINFSYLLNSFRIDHAKKLLKSTKLSNIDIAYECGYANERSFYRQFKRVTGKTPSQYKL